MVFDALVNHASREERLAIGRQHRAALLTIGVLTGYMGAFPSLVWASGAVFAAAFLVLIPLAIWIYALVFAFTSLWFAHYSLGALEALRAESGTVFARTRARFKRLPNGVGAVKSLDRSSSSIAADQFGMYYGNIELGKKVGIALEINEASVYSGRFVEGHRRGKGRIDFGDGTLVVGEFGYNTVYDNKVSLVFDNPYVGGEPNHDDCEVLFADGARRSSRVPPQSARAAHVRAALGLNLTPPRPSRTWHCTHHGIHPHSPCP
jgi:hypothetical protein